MTRTRIISALIIAVLTIGVFGGFFVVRAVTVPPLRAGLVVWQVLSPIPRVVSNDTRLLYIAVIPEVQYGVAPYTVQVFIGSTAPGDLYAYYVQTYSGTNAPVLWSENAPRTPSTLFIQVLVADNASATSTAFTTIHLPTS